MIFIKSDIILIILFTKNIYSSEVDIVIKYLKKINYLRKQNLYKNYINSILDVVDFTPIVNEMPDKVKTITFVIPGMPAYSGGHTSILRLGSELSKSGYIVNYVSFTPQSIEDMKKNAVINLITAMKDN